MPTNEEKAAFAQRLTLALRRSPEPVNGATELALRFNLRYEGEAVSAQTAHNWIAGRTIPTNDKLVALAAWLRVDLHWLHYGDSPAKQKSGTKTKIDKRGATKPSAETIRLATKIQNMPARWRYLVEELVDRVDQDIE